MVHPYGFEGEGERHFSHVLPDMGDRRGERGRISVAIVMARPSQVLHHPHHALHDTRHTTHTTQGGYASERAAGLLRRRCPYLEEFRYRGADELLGRGRRVKFLL